MRIILSVVENLVILIGLSVMLYPYFSDWWNQLHESHVIATYAQDINSNTEEENEALFQEAVAYNEDVADHYAAGDTLTEEELSLYDDVLDSSDMGIMGYIEIEKIDCMLPIYHDTDDSVLQIAIGHLPWSSLPVGNEDSHTVLSGHRGLPSAELFTRLDEMEIGDTFSVYVLNHKLTYEVDQIKTVLPTDMTYFAKEEGQTYCTLMTCTPYGINTHRLLVRGSLISNEIVSTEELVETTTTEANNHIWKMVLIVAGVILLIIILLLIRRHFRKKKKAKESAATVAAEDINSEASVGDSDIEENKRNKET